MYNANIKSKKMTEGNLSYSALWKRLKKMPPEKAVGYEV